MVRATVFLTICVVLGALKDERSVSELAAAHAVHRSPAGVEGADRQILLHPIAECSAATRKGFARKSRKTITRWECRIAQQSPFRGTGHSDIARHDRSGACRL